MIVDDTDYGNVKYIQESVIQNFDENRLYNKNDVIEKSYVEKMYFRNNLKTIATFDDSTWEPLHDVQSTNMVNYSIYSDKITYNINDIVIHDYRLYTSLIGTNDTTPGVCELGWEVMEFNENDYLEAVNGVNRTIKPYLDYTINDLKEISRRNNPIRKYMKFTNNQSQPIAINLNNGI